MTLSSFRKQSLLVEFSRLRFAELSGVFVSITPGDPALWVGVIFVRKGMACMAMPPFHNRIAGVHIHRSLRICGPKIPNLFSTQLSDSAASRDLFHRCFPSTADTSDHVHVHDWIARHRHRQRNR
jgi:hypothetical protein